MKTQIFSALAALAFVGFVSTTPALAQDQAPTGQIQHDGHHPDPATSSAKPMKMGSKKGMVEKCSSEMNKSECKKMMKQMKSQSELTKKK